MKFYQKHLAIKLKRFIHEIQADAMSLQLHHLRSEHWFLLFRARELRLSTAKKNLYVRESSMIFPKKVKHRIQNSSEENLIIIEVQNRRILR